MKLHIAVCDDEPIIANEIKENLIQHNPEYDVDIYHSGKELLEQKKEYDLIFLDIEMPKMDGMEVAEELQRRHYEGNVVFLTSHTEFMQDAFKVRAFRFLEKPVKTEEWKETLIAVEKEIAEQKKIVINTLDGVTVINIKDIIYIEAARNYTFIYTKQESYETRKTLYEWLDILGEEHVCQVHKSYAIAFRYIDKIEKTGIKMKYVTVKIPISRRKYGELREKFFAYIKKYAVSV